MSDSLSLNIEEILRESIDNYEKALKSGIKLQENTINLWKDVLKKIGSPAELRTKLDEISAELLPATRKQFEEVVETVNRTGNQVLSLTEKTISVYKAPTVPEAQSRFRDLTESYFAVTRENLKFAIDANARAIGYWNDLVGRLAPAAR